ncbi:molybdopterin-dependent oxidoreductase [Aquabacterium sp.]|uniref:molybdopterin-dependent oxidoreductase n=1 Tax=Aquabacterium sp. TaxID=1872578 RepID=UPI0035AF27F3
MMNITKRGWMAMSLAIALTRFAAPAHAVHTPDDPSAYVTHSVVITGTVEHPQTVTVSDLRKLPPQRVSEVGLVCQSGADMGKLQNVKGVRLTDLLDQAVIQTPGHNDVKKMVVIATASDDYAVVFSWTELYNSPLGDGVVVYFEKDGVPLGDDEGRIAMVSSKDTRTGPRHVKWLKRIEVRKVVD